MRVVCYVEPVPDVSVPIEIAESGADILRDGIFHAAGGEDCCAVEEAVRIRERGGGARVTALAVGGPEVIPVLRTCLAIGADHAIHIEVSGLGDLDARVTASIVAAAASRIGYNLILAGNRGRDACPSDVPAYISAMIGLPQVSNVARLEIASSRETLVAWRKLERGWLESVECPLPALLTVERSLNQPRYASLPSQLSAWERPIETVDLAALGLRPEQVGPRRSLTRITAVTPPQPRTKKTFTPDSALSPEDRLKLIIGGPAQQKKSPVVSGSPEKLAREFLSFLKAAKILD